MKCPKDGAEMDHVVRHGVEIDHCPQCGGVWLDRGELEKVLEAVRPAVELEDPAPAQPAPQPAAAAGTHGKRYSAEKPKKPKKPVRFEDRERDKTPRPGKSKRYGSKYSRKSVLKNVLEEIFDFD